MSRKRSHYRKACAAAAAAAVGVASPLFGQTVSNWTSPTSGPWTDAVRWSTNPASPNNGSPPGATYDAIIDAAGSPYSVSLATDIALHSFTLNSADATLSQTDGTFDAGTVTLGAGTYLAAGGTLIASSLTGPAGAALHVGGTFTLDVGALNTDVLAQSGSALTLTGNWSNSRTVSVTGGTLTLAGSPTSLGSLSLTNSSLDVATILTTTQITSASSFNNSSIRVIDGGGVDNTGSTISLSPSSPAWTLAGGQIAGGSISSTGGAKLAVAPGTTSALTGVSLAADVDVPANSTLILSSLASNTGTVNVNGGTLRLGGLVNTPALGSIHNNGGTVLITGVVNNAGTLSLDASTGPWKLAPTGTIGGGTLAGSAPDNLVALGGTLTGVTLAGDLTVGDATATSVALSTSNLSLANGARITLNAPAGASSVGLLPAGTQPTLNGAAEIVFDGAGDGAYVRAATSGQSLTFGPALTVRTGARGGTLGGAGTNLVNRGLISAQTAGRTLAIQGPFNNQGLVEASNGSTLSAAGNLTNAGTISVGASSALKVAGTLTNSGKVDLAGGTLVLDYTGTSPTDWLRSQLASGRNGGTWDGATGVTSSSAAADSQHRLAVGYAEASALGVSSWAGVGVDTTALVTKITWYGDANLDGTVNADDYALLDRGFARHLTGWVNGDFDYSGAVDAGDYLLVDRTYLLQGGTLSPADLAAREAQFGSAYAAQLLATVPEPSAVLLLTAAGLPLVLRRKRDI